MAADWEWANDAPPEEAEGSVPLPAFARDPLGVLRRRWLWMVLCFGICAGGVAGLVSTREPTYLAETTILVSSQAILALELSVLAAGFLGFVPLSSAYGLALLLELSTATGMFLRVVASITSVRSQPAA